MRTTVLEAKKKLIVKGRDILIDGVWLSGFGSHASGEWLTPPKLLREELKNQFKPLLNPNLFPYKIELIVNNKFVLETELDDISDELDSIIIERFDDLRLNFNEELRIKIVAITR